MLVDTSDGSLAQTSETVLARLSGALSRHASPETHASVVELTSGVHANVAGAAAELEALRTRLALELRPMGMQAASAGIYPLAGSRSTRVVDSERYAVIARSMGALARREPTMALHVHVGVPDPEDAIRLLNGLRCSLPLLIALAANSPFCQGTDSGFASARALIFRGFPRTGPPRPFADYADYVDAVEPLVASGALPDATYLWWDVRLQPALGTVEVRVMDAQSSVAESAPLVALVQSLARLELEGDSPVGWPNSEVLAENCFLAARDGLDARLIDPIAGRLVPVRTLIDTTLARCAPHAEELGCSGELDGVAELAVVNGAERQRVCALADGPSELVRMLMARFAAPQVAAAEPGSLIQA